MILQQMRVALQPLVRSGILSMPVPCRKHAHPSHGSAEAHIRALHRLDKGGVDAHTLAAYYCPRCLKWHVGHAGY